MPEGQTPPATISLGGRPPQEAATLLRGEHRRAVARTPDGEVVILGHAEARAVAEDPARFSSRVSTHLQLPNGLDGEEHARYRTLVARYLEREVVEQRGPEFRAVARDVIAGFLEAPRSEVDAVGDLGARYAVQAMTTWLGWLSGLEEQLIAWVHDNAAATRSGDPHRTAEVADEFDRLISAVLEPRTGTEAASFSDVTQQLVEDTSLGRRLHHREIVSILRNWTGGDLSSMALCIGVILHRLAADTRLQDHLRSGVSAEEFGAVADEMLRLDSPFVSNRRVTTCPVSVGGVDVPAGQRVRIHWTAANLDPWVFPDPAGFDPGGHAADNLVWGAGPHVCPGRSLSMVELQAFIEELLVAAVVRPGTGPGTRAVHPLGGWEKLPVTLERR